jgi:uncharacterized ferritin-like protein (DUF455 family)
VDVELFAEAARCLLLSDPGGKCLAVERLHATVEAGAWCMNHEAPVPPVEWPGRPEQPELMNPAKMPRRRLGSPAGRVALVHAVAHIEFNAINLALDAACRFRGMPEQYYCDWISVAADEARHYLLLSQRLEELGASYGTYPAHNGLWEMAERTADSCLVRMALVPRVLEARGLDVTPGMVERLRQIGDLKSATTLELILGEEVRHVAIGSHWFSYCCALEGRAPVPTFLRLLETHYSGKVRGPFNIDARLAAGFTECEMAALQAAQ